MKTVSRIWVIPLLLAPSAAAVAAGKYSWFGDPLTATAPPTQSSAFGVDVYRSNADSTDTAGSTTDAKVSLYGDYAARNPGIADDSDASRRFSNFGVRWQQQMSATDRLSFSAQQGDSLRLRPTVNSQDASGSRAAVSWTRELSWLWKPSISGGVYLGDETPRDDSFRFIGRRYFGFALGGAFRGFQSHTPYLSLRMERSLYDTPGVTDDGIAVFSRTTEDSSRFAAGWRWQAARGWSLQAEASYGFNFGNNGSDLLTPDRERSRVLFGTRFDFR